MTEQMEYSLERGGDFEHLRTMPIELFLAEAASYLFQRSVDKLGGSPMETVNLPELEDESRALSESVSVEYEGRTGDIRLRYGWTARDDGERTGHGSTEATRLKFDGTEVKWATRHQNGSQGNARREVIEPSEIHENYFRNIVIRALIHRRESLKTKVKLRNVEIISSPLL